MDSCRSSGFVSEIEENYSIAEAKIFKIRKKDTDKVNGCKRSNESKTPPDRYMKSMF